MAQRKQEHVKPREVYKHSSFHREELLKSDVCGCFCCLQRFPPAAIERWADAYESSDFEGQTAICPMCGVDAVIGSASGFEITDSLLERMETSYFGGTATRAKRKTKSN